MKTTVYTVDLIAKIKSGRGKLSIDEMEAELKAIAKTGLKEILILTGESRHHSGVEYIGEGVKLATRYFSTVGIEIYPLNSDEYAYLRKCGADFCLGLSGKPITAPSMSRFI